MLLAHFGILCVYLVCLFHSLFNIFCFIPGKKKKTILCKDLRPTTVGPIGLGARLTKGCLKSVFLVRQHDDDGGVPPFLPLVS